MKRVLGLDLGASSIGWAIVDEYNNEFISDTDIAQKDKIVALGSRIIPLTNNESTQYSKGQALTKNADRTKNRTQRKGYDRYQLRRALLLETLAKVGMYNGASLPLSKLELWAIRAKATDEQISLSELGRVLCHINQKRGYRTAKSDYADKKNGAYVQKVVTNYNIIKEDDITIGQYLYNNLKVNPAFRCKDIIFPRDAYVEEYDRIMDCQKRYYPTILTEEFILHIRNYIIFHQRPLKSCKHLVAKCELERREINANGKIRFCAPKVAHRSSPLFQVCKIWESINNLSIRNKYSNDILHITLEQKQKIFDFMKTNEKLKATALRSILGLKSKDWQIEKSIGNGLQGDTTYCAINKCGVDKNLLSFNLNIVDRVDETTGEVINIVDNSFENEPLYELWHAVYSISDIEELSKVLKNKFKIADDDVVHKLCQIDFVKLGYCNKSSRAIRRILPHLQQGMNYHDAKLAAGYHDVTPTKEENQKRELLDSLPLIKKGELRQPVVEKILNQLVNLVNALLSEYGRFDEIRVELARELKQSREERETATKSISKNQKENEDIAKRIMEYEFTPTRSRIQKYKMWEETEHVCIYCGRTVGVKDFLSGAGVEVEHIIPRSVLFDDSFSNKVCSCRECNKEKNNRTAYDFMKSKSSEEFETYIERVCNLGERGLITKTKQKKLLMPADEIPNDFIERQLRESQYIAKKAKEMLQDICYNVYSTTGSITDFIRHIWGWDDVLHSLNIERYRNAGLTVKAERDVNGGKQFVERIDGWSKRMDHRHHAIDALVIACTKQGYIQRINNLNTLKEISFTPFTDSRQDAHTGQRLTLLERYILMQPHFSTNEVSRAVESIAVSFKSGKRVATIGKRYVFKNGKRQCVQQGIIVPRGALSEESVYGRIKNSENAGKKEIVIKYKIDTIKNSKDVDSIVDKRIREIVRTRLEQYDWKPENAFKEHLLDHQGRIIRSVRCKAGLNAIVPLRYNKAGEPISFVKPGNNHHVAIYKDENGKWQEHIVTFWHAVERKKFGLPVIITNPTQVWDNVTDAMPESFQEQLPENAKWQFLFSMQQNEMFILEMDEELYQDAMRRNNYDVLSKHLYRVQKIAKGSYYFRHHLETTVDDKYNGAKNEMLSKQMGKLIRINSLKVLEQNNPHKVRVSITGRISEA